MKGKAKRLLIALAAVVTVLTGSVSAAPYQTYTYSYSGDVQVSPAAYDAKYKINSFGEAGTLNEPTEMIYDKRNDRILIADTGNNRIVVLDASFRSVAVISGFRKDGKEENLSEPRGIFLTNDGYLYVADTGNGRILIFDSRYQFVRELPPISADILPSDFTYNPKSIAVDAAKNVYVISLNTNMGVITLDPDGNFGGFIGAQRVSVNLFEYAKRAFMTEEQLERSVSFVPVTYSQLTIDKKGFLYVTCSDIDRFDLYSAVQSRSSESTYAPLKKLNPSGTDVLRRNGFFPPVGDVDFDPYDGTDKVDPSAITEVNLLDNGMYSLLDSEHNKLFTYDAAGNLLYAFGGFGEAIGLYTKLISATYRGDALYTLDQTDASLTVSEKTDYGRLIDEVIGYQENREYDKAKSLWNTVLSENNNFDIAYLGIGKIFMEKKQYKKAMEYFRLIDNKNYYSRAYKLSRQQALDRYGVLVFFGIIVIVVALILLFRKINRHNKEVLEHPASGKFRDEFLLGFYTIAHPFQGYWGLKQEKRGTVRAALAWLALFSVSAVANSLAACYLLKADDATVVTALSNTLFPLILWCVSNVCFTSLMDGKGTFRDVFIAACYSTVPYVLLTIPCTAMGYLLINEEMSLLSMVLSFGVYWTVALIFMSGMTVHDYSFGKNLLVVLLTVLGIAFILFILLLFISLGGRMVALVSSIVTEISYRP